MTDQEIIEGYWQQFLQTRNCPHCDNEEWTAEVKDLGTVKQRWVYACADKKNCGKLWAAGRFTNWISYPTRSRWALPGLGR